MALGGREWKRVTGDLLRLIRYTRAPGYIPMAQATGIGSRTVKVLPLPGSLLARISP